MMKPGASGLRLIWSPWPSCFSDPKTTHPATLGLGAVGFAIAGAYGRAVLDVSGAALGGFIGSVVDNRSRASPRRSGSRARRLTACASVLGWAFLLVWIRASIWSIRALRTRYASRVLTFGAQVLRVVLACSPVQRILASSAARIEQIVNLETVAVAGILRRRLLCGPHRRTTRLRQSRATEW